MIDYKLRQYATYAAKRTPADGLIDWRAAAADIERLVRAVGKPYPGAFTYDRGERLTVWRSTFLPDAGRYHATEGQIVDQTEEHFTVMTGDGLLRVEDWESGANKRPRLHSILGSL